MAFRKLSWTISAASSAAVAIGYMRYRREMSAIEAGLDAASRIADTSVGPLEYGELGEGEPLLIVHGAGGGYDQGLLLGRELGGNFRLIAPSRFGYLRTPVPEDSSPTAQAEAHVALLDYLGLAKVIVAAASAGAPSAIELTLRHPDRVSALILLVPRAYHPDCPAQADESMQSQAVLRAVQGSANFAMWLAMRLSRPAVVRFLGVPPQVEAKAPIAERERVTQIMKSLLPLSRRVRGILVDGAARILPLPLERISRPVLIFSAEDDLYRTLPGAKLAAQHIAGSELHVLPTGGHLMVGQMATVRRVIASFLKRHHVRERTLKSTRSQSIGARRVERGRGQRLQAIL